jgi:hypothetical protein
MSTKDKPLKSDQPSEPQVPSPPAVELTELKLEVRSGTVGLNLHLHALAREKDGASLESEANAIHGFTVRRSLDAAAEEYLRTHVDGQEWTRRVGIRDELAKRLGELKAKREHHAGRATGFIENKLTPESGTIVDAAERERRSELESKYEAEALETLLADAQKLLDAHRVTARAGQSAKVRAELSRHSNDATLALNRLVSDTAAFLVKQAGGLPALLALCRAREAYGVGVMAVGPPDQDTTDAVSNALTVK